MWLNGRGPTALLGTASFGAYGGWVGPPARPGVAVQDARGPEARVLRQAVADDVPRQSIACQGMVSRRHRFRMIQAADSDVQFPRRGVVTVAKRSAAGRAERARHVRTGTQFGRSAAEQPETVRRHGEP